MPRKLYVTFSMDGERIKAESPPGGPATWELSGRAIESYCRTLLDGGFKPTLFYVPECAQYHANLVRDLDAAGVESGMHTHPQSFLDLQYEKYLGEYDREMQKYLIETGRDMLAEVFGKAPTSFRAGNLSASNDTFPVLAELGFRQGSSSLPERNAPNFAAIWTGAERYVHWTNADDMLRAGNLPLLEIPLTIDPYNFRDDGNPSELRIEHGGFEDFHLPILNAALEEMEKTDPPMCVVCIFTHNFIDYGNPEDPRAITLKKLIEHISALDGYEVVPANMADIRREWVRLVGEPA